MDIVVIGIDTGEVTGIAKLRLRARHIPGRRVIVATECAQVTSGLVIPILNGMLAQIEKSARIVIATERFVVGPRAARSSTAKAGTTARDLVTLVRAWAGQVDATVVERSAAEVKPWATDERLDRAGLLDAAQKMRHAKDGGRHALFEACKSHNVPDPLSRQGRYV